MDYLNPISENFILKKLWEFFTTLLSYLNPFNENFILRDIVDFVVNFVDIIIHIIVPTEEQQQYIANNYSELGDQIKNKLPFISWFNEEINNVEVDGLGSKDFLKIKMPSFSFFGGQTEEKVYIDVFEAYEPYRENIRSKLSILVYLCGVFVLIKYILGDMSSGSKGNSDGEGV